MRTLGAVQKDANETRAETIDLYGRARCAQKQSDYQITLVHQISGMSRYREYSRRQQPFELQRFGELDSCDGLSYLVSLGDGLPRIPNLESYVRIVSDKAILRKIVFTDRCLSGEEDADQLEADKI